MRKSTIPAGKCLRVIESVMASSKWEKYDALTVEERVESMDSTLAMGLKEPNFSLL